MYVHFSVPPQPLASSHSTRQPQSMVAYLWLVYYQANSNTTPKHWALAVTYELHERAYATFYEVCALCSVFPSLVSPDLTLFTLLTDRW